MILTSTRMQIYHNYFRENQGLKGKTPSEACGIEIKGKNKWKTMIENASVQRTTLQPTFDNGKLL